MGLITLFKRVSVVSILVMAVTYFTKDSLPTPDYYDQAVIREPIQNKINKKPFEIEVNRERYQITPKYDYCLEGVVVSVHNADAFLDMRHHEEWRDFLNIRDLCVIWGDNVKNGVYKEMDFSNGDWTCWYSWPNAEVRQHFRSNQLSNNHLLAEKEVIKQSIMKAEPGDHILLEGMLVDYANPANSFKRGTSTSRTDAGQGACETIYVKKFEIIQKANALVRNLFQVAKILFILSLVSLVFLYFTQSRKVSMKY